MATLERIEKEIETLFADAAMAEGRDFPDAVGEIEAAAENVGCSFVDVTFAEAGIFTETACPPRNN